MYFTSVFRQTNLRKRKIKNFRVTNEQMEKLNRNSFYIFLYSLLLYVCLSCYLCKSLRLCVFVCVCVYIRVHLSNTSLQFSKVFSLSERKVFSLQKKLFKKFRQTFAFPFGKKIGLFANNVHILEKAKI
jgi:hypothetical protein